MESKLRILLVGVLFILMATSAYAECKARFVNIFSDVKWDGIFPIEIAGIEIKGPSTLRNPDKINKVVCYCRKEGKIMIGIAVSFWEPARVVETVKDPWCFPLLGGLKLNASAGLNAGGSQTSTTLGTHNSGSIFQQAHWYMFSVWNLLDLFMDVPCLKWDGFDIAYVTELDPTWQRDDLAMFLSPEVLLFANPVAQLACIADSVTAQAGYPLDPLFWCIGSWGSVYPLSGKTSMHNLVEGNAALASRMIYKISRELLMWDPAIDLCGPVITPIWVKTHYKMHIMKPVLGNIVQLGQSGLIWGAAKNPPFGTSGNAPDNFDFMVFRRVKCCMGYTITGR